LSGRDRLSGRDTWYRVLRVQVSTNATIEILTNLLWLDAAQICRLYHHRWSIEIVFRWLKDRLQLDHFISRDPRGILRQIVTALIVWGLLTIYNRGTAEFRPKELMRKVRRAQEQALFEFGRQCQKHGVSPFD
jgi:IS4 transposase